MATNDRPSLATVHDLLSDWTQYHDRIIAGVAPSSLQRDGINLAPMPRTVEGRRRWS